MTAHPALIETTSWTTAEFRPAPRHVDRAGAVRRGAVRCGAPGSTSNSAARGEQPATRILQRSPSRDVSPTA
ncbi:hypothetical protein [Streptomyces sp. KO7888]|uniref:hypothetical protein n=1 Tax=Streptomyces sp. KO7888 TaxID=2602737 RepID=UPI0013F64222|nr:hypothetical protein [Streptomyces sp. KO7888]